MTTNQKVLTDSFLNIVSPAERTALQRHALVCPVSPLGGRDEVGSAKAIR